LDEWTKTARLYKDEEREKVIREKERDEKAHGFRYIEILLFCKP